MSAGLLVALLVAWPVARQENRSWMVDLELEGPLEELVLDCGDAGESRVRAELVAGERRRVSVPVPARVPLGPDALASVPLPDLASPIGGGSARVLRWSEVQPVRRTQALVALLARPRPPLPGGPAFPGLGVLAVAGAGWILAASLRRRPVLALGVSLLTAGGVAALGGLEGAPSDGIRLIDANDGRALEIRAARGSLALPAERVEVLPAGSPLVFTVALSGEGIAGTRTAGACLLGLDVVRPPELSPDRNGFGDLAACWVRTPDGRWRAHGAWGLGSALPAATAPSRPDAAPPGWLGTGLPAGRSVLVGRRAGQVGGEAWVRVVGFGERD